jgi:deoxycytidylate deaminase
MATAREVARRSPCVRTQAGAVVVTAENRVVATGYNGFPAGRATNPSNCDSPFGCSRALDGPEEPHTYLDCIAVHAEANALLFCDRDARLGGTIYVTTNVCWECAKLIANSGLSRVVMVVDRDYRPIDQVRDLFTECQIEAFKWKD